VNGPSDGASRLADLLARPRYEVVPLRGVDEEVEHLPPGATVTVTSSPRRGLEPMLSLAERLSGAGFRAVPHLSARLVRGPAELDEVAERLVAGGIGEVFVVGGDAPTPSGPYPSALSLLRGLAEGGYRFDTGIAGYPERHPIVADQELRRALVEKMPFASYMVTQICFEPRTVAAWVRDVRRAGLDLPVHVGVVGAGTRARLLEIALRVGVGDSVRYVRAHRAVVARLMGRSWRPEAFVARVVSLLPPDAGLAGFHINTFNRIQATEGWRRALVSGRSSNGVRESTV
jgi:methylenetetrahydrofolate reductase (NADH)